MNEQELDITSPDERISYKEIRRRLHFVYGLFIKERCHYIGKTIRGLRRLLEHRVVSHGDLKNPDALIYIWYRDTDAELYALEIKLIAHFRPLRNTIGNIYYNENRNVRQLRSDLHP